MKPQNTTAPTHLLGCDLQLLPQLVCSFLVPLPVTSKATRTQLRRQALVRCRIPITAPAGRCQAAKLRQIIRVTTSTLPCALLLLLEAVCKLLGHQLLHLKAEQAAADLAV